MVDVPSESSTIAPGGRLPVAVRRLISTPTARLTASPIAVCPLAWSCPSAERAEAWSVVGDWSRTGFWLNSITPTRIVPGTLARNCEAARSAAPSRDGATSTEAIELLTSSTSITAPSVSGTATLRCGRAAATISAASATVNASIGAWRRQPGELGATDGDQRLADERRRGPCPPTLLADVPAEHQRDGQQRQENQRCGKAHGDCAGRAVSFTRTV